MEAEFRKKYPDAYAKYEWSDKYVAQYPELFTHTHHIGVGKGWEHILSTLLSVIDHHVSNLPEELKGQIYIVQIKEKFGGLRFYMNHETPFINGAITFAERLSESTCEDCGAPGTKKQVGGWISCRCGECHVIAEEELKRRNQKYLEEQRARKKK